MTGRYDKENQKHIALILDKIDVEKLNSICKETTRNKQNTLRYLIRKEYEALNRPATVDLNRG